MEDDIFAFGVFLKRPDSKSLLLTKIFISHPLFCDSASSTLTMTGDGENVDWSTTEKVGGGGGGMGDAAGAVIILQSAQQQQQQIPAAASIAPIAPAPPAPAASPIPPPPPPTFSAVDHSMYSPSPAMVEVLEVLSQHKWRMRNKPLCQQQTLAIGTLHEDPSCDGVVLNINVTGDGKSHSMRLSITYDGAWLYVDSI